MENKEFIITKMKEGYTDSEIAKEIHKGVFYVSQIRKQINFPTANIIKKCINNPDFVTKFKQYYLESTSTKEFIEKICNEEFFHRMKKESIQKRLSELRNYLDLPPKMFENKYMSEYDRIRGYIIRNTKFMAKRRGIYFDLKYTDFELPEYCPLLNVKLTYLHESGGNDPFHASLDRIDNTKGYVKGNVIVISKLANAMKNSANFEQLETFSKNILKLIDYKKNHGTLGSITDIFGCKLKGSLDS